MYFYTPSSSAKNLLYYPVAVGNFYCKSNYSVQRENYNSILILYVLDGCITFCQNDLSYTAKSGELLLIDCYKSHKYYANCNSHTLWIHFDGNNSREWCKEISDSKSQKINATHIVADCILSIIENIKNNKSEFDISSLIYKILCEISKPSNAQIKNDSENTVDIAKEYIELNYSSITSINEIAKEINISPSYFSKIFKKSQGISPYNYLLSIRLLKAKELLRQTNEPISNIAFKTGFNSTSNFIYFFTQQTGLSPLKFRKILF